MWLWRPKLPRRGGIHLSVTSIKHTGGTKLAKSQIDWEKIMNDVSTKNYFDERLIELNKEGAITYTSFLENVMRAAKDTATTIKRSTIGWFEENKELLKPPIKEKHSLQAK